MGSLFTETQVSEILQVNLACLRRWRLRGEGPRYIKVGPLVRYRPGDVDEWLGALPTAGNGRRLSAKAERRNRLAVTAKIA